MRHLPLFNRTFRRPAWAAAGLLVAAVSAWGATPLGTAWTYQGQLNQNGSRVNDTCDCQFTLWDDPSAGLQIGPTLSFNGQAGNPPPVTVVNGLLTVQLDFGPNVFNGDARWLQIAVACPAGNPLVTLTPRQSITPGPYTLYALNSPGGQVPSSGAIQGLWLLEQGIMLPAFDTSLEVTALSLGTNGTGRVFFRDISTGANDCVRVLYLFYNNDSLLIDFVREPSLKFHPERTNVFPTVILEDDFLGLADSDGNIAIFSRQTALPADVTCDQLAVTETFTGLPAPHSFGDLVLFQGDLLYNSNNSQIEVFDLATSAIAAPLGPTNNRFLQTTQTTFNPPHFWHHCGCGGSPDIFRSNLSTVFDTIHTGNDLSRQITIRAAEYILSTGRLWLHGFESSAGRFRFLVVNSNAEPDVLDQVFDFNRDVRGLSFDGSHFWAFVTMATRSIVRIDPGTGRVVESFELPDEDLFWTGLEVIQNDIYVIGTDANQQGILYKLARP